MGRRVLFGRIKTERGSSRQRVHERLLSRHICAFAASFHAAWLSKDDTNWSDLDNSSAQAITRSSGAAVRGHGYGSRPASTCFVSSWPGNASWYVPCVHPRLVKPLLSKEMLALALGPSRTRKRQVPENRTEAHVNR